MVILTFVFFIFVLMTLDKYISNLLYRYECVIVPNFGGFITNTIPAKVNHYTHTFDAPSKRVTFNIHLQNNDGLLANYIAGSENISYSKAIRYIDKEVSDWKSLIQKEELELVNIGSFNLNKKGHYIFDPSQSINYLSSSFGLSSFVSPSVKRLTYKQQLKETERTTPVIPISGEKSKTPAFIKYAAAVAVIFALGSIGFKEYKDNAYNQLLVQAEQQQQKVEKSIQEATFVIQNPLPSITLNVVKETYHFHIIAGAFREPGNAIKKQKELQQKGYKAKILGVNKWNLTPVAYQSLNDRSEALKVLKTVKREESEDAWLLVKEF